MESVIKWQTGEPTESGSYLASIKGIESHFVTCVIYNCVTGWCHWKKEKIVAWCKLSDIEPYKEETKWEQIITQESFRNMRERRSL